MLYSYHHFDIYNKIEWNSKNKEDKINSKIMSKKSNSVLDKLMPLGTIQRRQRQKKESNDQLIKHFYDALCFNKFFL